MRTATTFVAALLLAGCAVTRSAAPESEPHPLEGDWDYTLDTPQGVYTGIFNFEVAEDGLAGTVMQEGGAEPAILEELAFDDMAGTATFSFDSGEYGIMVVHLTLEEDAMSGLLTALDFAVDLPIVANRGGMDGAEE